MVVDIERMASLYRELSEQGSGIQSEAFELASNQLTRLANQMKKEDFPDTLRVTTQGEQESNTLSGLAQRFDDFAMTAPSSETTLATTAAITIRQIDQSLGWFNNHPTHETTSTTFEKHERPTLGKLLKRLRKETMYTQEQIAKLTWKRKEQIYKLENVTDFSIVPIAEYIQAIGFYFTDQIVLDIPQILLNYDMPTASQQPRPKPEQVQEEISRLRKQDPELTLGKYMRWIRSSVTFVKPEKIVQPGISYTTLNHYETGLSFPSTLKLFTWLHAIECDPHSMETAVAWVLALEQASSGHKEELE